MTLFDLYVKATSYAMDANRADIGHVLCGRFKPHNGPLGVNALVNQEKGDTLSVVVNDAHKLSVEEVAQHKHLRIEEASKVKQSEWLDQVPGFLVQAYLLIIGWLSAGHGNCTLSFVGDMGGENCMSNFTPYMNNTMVVTVSKSKMQARVDKETSKVVVKDIMSVNLTTDRR